MTDRKKPGVAFWATVGLVVVLVGYALSFGPMCWLVGMGVVPRRVVYFASDAYNPLIERAIMDEPPFGPALSSWASLGCRTGADVLWLPQLDD